MREIMRSPLDEMFY